MKCRELRFYPEFPLVTTVHTFNSNFTHGQENVIDIFCLTFLFHLNMFRFFFSVALCTTFTFINSLWLFVLLTKCDQIEQHDYPRAPRFSEIIAMALIVNQVL